MGDLKPYKGNYYLWYYVPSLPAAIIFLLLFIAATTLHIYRLFKTRTWFCIPFAIGGICRCTANRNTASLFSYALANNGILLAPALFAASIYMTLGRLLRFLHAEHLSLINVQWLTKIFVIGDVLSFAVQGSSVGLSITGHDVGAKAVIIVGLLIQIISFGLFGITTVAFYRRVSSSSSTLATPSGKHGLEWMKILYMLYYTSGLIMIRSVFRLVEYIMGNNGYLLRHEWTISLKVGDKGFGGDERGLVHSGESQSTGFMELESSENKR
uniref:Protein RTM1 n=1 Tax=Talaromyces marneffei PM1 TaxID=1077442 RepID=A0A093XCV8_TALMA